ncbi:hypothetical protein Ctaglu_26750 [Clostridium tagluense]|uniref:Uncharacterized protein n=1 Tax=Clostridium tagluense TaxID=360422 RepID=A0A401UNE0_9CLOT|nr:hypothetical protein Ctaglu_26750 [Clostridium tagluense]
MEYFIFVNLVYTYKGGVAIMRILVGQPIHEKNADQLEKEIKNNPNIDMDYIPRRIFSR